MRVTTDRLLHDMSSQPAEMRRTTRARLVPLPPEVRTLGETRQLREERDRAPTTLPEDDSSPLPSDGSQTPVHDNIGEASLLDILESIPGIQGVQVEDEAIEGNVDAGCKYSSSYQHL